MKPQNELLAVLREHAYEAIATERFLTILPTAHGARVPSHWVKEADAHIASALSTETLREELARREQGPTR